MKRERGGQVRYVLGFGLGVVDEDDAVDCEFPLLPFPVEVGVNGDEPLVMSSLLTVSANARLRKRVLSFMMLELMV